MFIYAALCIGAFASTYGSYNSRFHDLSIYTVLWPLLIIATLFGLNGYITKTKYFNSSFWKIIFVLIILNFFYEVFILLETPIYRDSMISSIVMMFLAEHINHKVLIPFEVSRYGIFVPMYVAIYMYGFNSNIWNEAQSNSLNFEKQ